jgi:hypothetical protein
VPCEKWIKKERRVRGRRVVEEASRRAGKRAAAVMLKREAGRRRTFHGTACAPTLCYRTVTRPLCLH